MSKAIHSMTYSVCLFYFSTFGWKIVFISLLRQWNLQHTLWDTWLVQRIVQSDKLLLKMKRVQINDFSLTKTLDSLQRAIELSAFDC